MVNMMTMMIRRFREVWTRGYRDTQAEICGQRCSEIQCVLRRYWNDERTNAALRTVLIHITGQRRQNADYYADCVCSKCIKTAPCSSVRKTVSEVARAATAKPCARQRQSRAAAGDAHRRLHTTRGPRKFWSDNKEVQHTCSTGIKCDVNTLTCCQNTARKFLRAV